MTEISYGPRVQPRPERAGASIFDSPHLDEASSADITQNPAERLAHRASVLPPSIVLDLYAVVDIILIILSAIGAKYIYINLYLENQTPDLPYLGVGVIVALIAYFQMRAAGAYKLERAQIGSLKLRTVVRAILFAFLFAVMAGYLLKNVEQFSRGWALLWIITSIIVVSGWHVAAAKLLRNLIAAGHLVRRVAVLGERGFVDQLVMPMRNSKGVDVALSFVFEPEYEGDRLSDKAGLTRFISMAQRLGIDDVIIAVPFAESGVIQNLVEQCSQLSSNIRLYHPFLSERKADLGAVRVADMTLFDAQTAPLTPWAFVAKALFDCIAAALLLVTLTPLFGIIAILIKLGSNGPVFFRQRRAGLDHAEFNVLKFRSMDCVEDGPVVTQAKRKDPRITKIGWFLRRTSLDELPQLINVMRGEMSLVGPRPHALAHNEEYGALIERYANRHRVKPGITGWAQINGYRGATEDPKLMAKRVEYDLYYIDNWSFWLDLRILLVTPFYCMFTNHAY